MLELTTTRHNAMIDPTLAVWSWEIPLYLFFGGVVAGMMVLAGVAMLRIAKGEDGKTFFVIFAAAFVVFLAIACVGQTLGMQWRSWLPGAESVKSVTGGVKAAVYTFMSHLQ